MSVETTTVPNHCVQFILLHCSTRTHSECRIQSRHCKDREKTHWYRAHWRFNSHNQCSWFDLLLSMTVLDYHLLILFVAVRVTDAYVKNIECKNEQNRFKFWTPRKTVFKWIFLCIWQKLQRKWILQMFWVSINRNCDFSQLHSTERNAVRWLGVA